MQTVTPLIKPMLNNFWRREPFIEPRYDLLVQIYMLENTNFISDFVCFI